MKSMTPAAWAAELEAAAGPILHREIEAVVKRAALNVKRDWQANARESAGRAAPAYPRSITFDDPQRKGATIEAEVGPDKDRRQGALGNLIEYGSVNNPPNNDGRRAAEVELPRFAAALSKTVAGMLA
jgi:hypothetical protein